MIRLLGLVTLLAVAHGGGTHSIKGRPSYGQRVVQEADLGGPFVKSTREEVSDPLGRVQGTYTVADPRGNAKVVHYAADEGGYRADVHTSEPNIVSGKGSVVGARHPLDPVSQAQDALLSGIQQQQALEDPLYRTGLSRVPYGLLGQDYYSFPAGLYSPRRTVKTIVSSGAGGLGGIGGGRKGGVGGLGAGGVGGIGAGGPGNIHFTLGDPQSVKGFGGLGSSRPVYSIGQSVIPYGLSGLDYYSYPASLYNQGGRRTVKTVISPGGAGGLGSVVSRVKGGGAGLGGGPGSIQYTLGDPSLGGYSSDPLYKIGRSQYPYGLSGSDYYSFPASMYSPRGTVKTVVTKGGAGGLGGIGALGGRKGGVGVLPSGGIAGSGPGNIQFTLGDPQGVKGFGGSGYSDPLYSIGLSRVPYGLSGGDYYSFPAGLYSQRPRAKTVITKTSRGGAAGLGGIADLAGGRGAGGFGPGNIQFTLGDPQGAKGFGGFSDPGYKIGLSQIPYGLSGSDYYSFPANLYNQRRTLTKISRGAGSGGIADAARRLAGAGGGSILDSQQQTLADIDPAVSALGGAPGSIQFTLGDSGLGGVKAVRKVIYRNGMSRVPYGLSGNDYYSYPAIMLGAGGRGYSGKASGGASSPFAGRLGGGAGSGGLLRDIQQDIAEQALTDPTFGGTGGSGIGQQRIVQVSDLGGDGGLGGPGSIQFTLGDSAGLGRPYSIGRSQYPFGLSGMDYYSYPANLQAPRRVKTIVSTSPGPGGIGARTTVTKIESADPRISAQRQIQEKLADPVLGGQAAIDPVLGGGPGNIHFTLGDPGVVQEKVTVVRPGGVLGDGGFGGAGDFGQRKIAAGPFGSGVAGVAPGSIHFTLGDPQIGLRKESQVAYIDGLGGFGGGRVAPVKKIQKKVVRTQDVGGPGGVTRLTRVTQKQVTRANAGAGPVVEFTLGDHQLIGDPVGATGIRPTGGVSKVVTQSKVLGAGPSAGPIAPGIQFTLGDAALGGGRPVAVSPVVQQEAVQVVDPSAGVGGLRRIPVRRLSPSKLASLGGRPIRVAQQQVTRAGGPGGPIIEFSLGDTQIVGGGRPAAVSQERVLDLGGYGRTSPASIPRGAGAGPNIQFTLGGAGPAAAVGPSIVSQGPVTQAELAGAGPAIDFALGGPAIDMARTSPARLTQEHVTGGGLSPHSQFTLGDSQILGDPSSAFGARPIGPSSGRLSQDDISGKTITQVTEIQQPVGLTSGGVGIIRKKVISEKFLPRMSFASPFSYDAPFDIYGRTYGGPGLVSKTTYGLRTSALRDPSVLGQQKITTFVDDGSGQPGLIQEKLGQVLVR